MSNRLIVLGSSAFFALAGLATAASAAVIDTFSFSAPSGWNAQVIGFSGSFTGSVEASGRIELSDLSAFQIDGRGLFGANSLSNLAFFTYVFSNNTGGASLLGFIDTLSALPPDTGISITVCSGAPSVLSLACNNPARGSNPVSTSAVVLIGTGSAGGVFTTPDLTGVTLVSSVNTNVPEPSTWAMMLVGFAGLGLVRYRIRLSPTFCCAANKRFNFSPRSLRLRSSRKRKYSFIWCAEHCSAVQTRPSPVDFHRLDT